MTRSLRLGLFLDSETRGHVRLQAPAGLLEAESFGWPLHNDLLERIRRWRQSDEKEPVDRVKLGRDLFTALIGEKVRGALARVIAQETAGRLLIAIRDVDADIAELPLELLHDGSTFLQGGNRVIYRDIRDFTESPNFRKVQHALFVFGESSEDTQYPAWGRDKFAAALQHSLKPTGIAWHFCCGSVSELLAELADKARARTPYDLVVIVAHGEAGRSGGDGVFILNKDGKADRLAASTLSRALSEHRGAVVAMISCHGAGGSSDNPFGSVARNVARDGGVSAVVAMVRKVTVDAGLAFCKDLVDCFSKNDDVHQAYSRAMAAPFLGNDEQGTVCLLSATPSDLSELDGDKAVLRELFNLEDGEKSRILLSLPAFRMGLPSDTYDRLADKLKEVVDGEYSYRSFSTSFPDLHVAGQLYGALSRLWTVDEVNGHFTVVSAEDLVRLIDAGGYTHFIIVGTRSHAQVAGLFKRYSDDFEFHFDETEWRIVDKREHTEFKTPDPSRQHANNPDQRFDYALIEKIVLDESKSMFFIAGLWDTSTQAAAQYLIRQRRKLVEQFGAGGFQIVLKVKSGTTHVTGEPLLSRRPQDAA